MLASLLLFALQTPLILAAPAIQPRVTLESQFPLWSLVHLEAKYPKETYPFARRPGNFKKANLRSLQAKYLRLKSFDFSEADLRGADFTGAQFENVSFQGSDLREAVFVSTRDEKVFFDAKTLLPFSRAEALRRGWHEIKK